MSDAGLKPKPLLTGIEKNEQHWEHRAGQERSMTHQPVHVDVLTFLSPCVIITGLHHHHVLPAVLEGQAPLLHRHPSQPHTGQPGGRPAVGP